MIEIYIDEHGNKTDYYTEDLIVQHSHRVNSVLVVYPYALTSQKVCQVAFIRADGVEVFRSANAMSKNNHEGIVKEGFYVILDSDITDVNGNLQMAIRIYDVNGNGASEQVATTVNHTLVVQESDAGSLAANDSVISISDYNLLLASIQSLNQPIIVYDVDDYLDDDDDELYGEDLLDRFFEDEATNGIYMANNRKTLFIYCDRTSSNNYNGNTIIKEGIILVGKETGTYIKENSTSGFEKFNDTPSLSKENYFTGKNHFSEKLYMEKPIYTDDIEIYGKLYSNIEATFREDVYLTESSPANVDFDSVVVGSSSQRISRLSSNGFYEQLMRNISEATTSAKGFMSATDKERLDVLYQILGNESGDADSVVNTIREVLAIFNQYPEGITIVQALNGKVDKTTYDAKMESLDADIERIGSSGVDTNNDFEWEGNHKFKKDVTITKENDEDDDIGLIANFVESSLVRADSIESTAFTTGIKDFQESDIVFNLEYYDDQEDFGISLVEMYEKVAYMWNEVIREITKEGEGRTFDTSEEKKLPYAVFNKLGGKCYKSENLLNESLIAYNNNNTIIGDYSQQTLRLPQGNYTLIIYSNSSNYSFEIYIGQELSGTFSNRSGNSYAQFTISENNTSVYAYFSSNLSGTKFAIYKTSETNKPYTQYYSNIRCNTPSEIVVNGNNHSKSYLKNELSNIKDKVEDEGYSLGLTGNYIDFENGKVVINYEKVAYTSGDENNSNYLTDGATETVKPLSSPIEIDISDILSSELFIKLDNSIILNNAEGNSDFDNDIAYSISYQVKGGVTL